MVAVSIIMPVYNGLQYLRPAIRSVLDQAYGHFEFIILDDGSTEDVARAIQEFSDERIRFIARENRGLGASLNELIQLASGELIARMDGDDICLPERLEQQVSFLQEHPEIGMVGGQINFLVENSLVKAFPMPCGHQDILAGLRQARFPICHPAIMFRKKHALACGGYRLGGAGEDLDFFLRMAEQGGLANVESAVLNYRISMNSLSMRKRHELNFGYSYALYNAERRSRCQDEVSREYFESAIWAKRSIWMRWGQAANDIAELFYRGSIVARAGGKLPKASLMLLLAAVFRPKAVVSRILARLKTYR